MNGDHPHYPMLFSPLRVGAVVLRNRVVNLPQGMGSRIAAGSRTRTSRITGGGRSVGWAW